MDEVLEMLHAVQPLSAALREHLSGVLRYRALPKKAFLLTAGHVCHNVYFIRKGLLRCFYLVDDTEVSAWFMKEQDVVISIESFYSQLPSHEYLQALETTELWYISYAELQRICRDYPEFNTTGRIIMQRYHQLWAWQLFALRMHNAKQRYRMMMERHPDLLLRVPAKYLSTYLGISEWTLSKIKSRR